MKQRRGDTGRKSRLSRAVPRRGRRLKISCTTFTRRSRGVSRSIWRRPKRRDATELLKSPYEDAHRQGALQAAGEQRVVPAENQREPPHLRQDGKPRAAFRSSPWEPSLENRPPQAPAQAGRHL